MLSENHWRKLCQSYQWDFATSYHETIGEGLINFSYKVLTIKNSYVLQKINNQVFEHPLDISHNVELVANHLAEHHPNYFFIKPITNIEDASLTIIDGAYYRVLPFVADSLTFSTVKSSAIAYEAARQFGQLTNYCKNLDINNLKIIIADFHQLQKRFLQFSSSVAEANQDRLEKSKILIESAFKYDYLVGIYDAFIIHRDVRLRVTHHDTKISNILFNNHDKALYVIDLDTLMPGYFISDVGDMLRTYCCTVSEEETDLKKLSLIPQHVDAVIDGYCAAMNSTLSAFEKTHLHYSGAMMIYMQGLRFLTDYLQNDRYYGSKYPHHNYCRAANQFKLLDLFLEQYSDHISTLIP